jgi:hypothetical protein
MTKGEQDVKETAGPLQSLDQQSQSRLRAICASIRNTDMRQSKAECVNLCRLMPS